MKQIFIAGAMFILLRSLTFAGDSPRIIKLWPAEAGINKAGIKEKITDNHKGNVIRITNVADPSMMYYPVKLKNKTTPAVIICPGGGYSILAINKEGTEIAEWLNRLGIAAFVLKYRVPGRRDDAFKDVQRAVRMVRSLSKELDIDPKRVGVLGFSAGAHLAARLSNGFKERIYSIQDAAEKQDCRPDFCVLVYPAYLAENGKVSKELRISKNAPKTLIIHTEDDKRHIGGSKAYDKALKIAGIPSKLLVYDTGGHGYGMRPSVHTVSQWPTECRKWLQSIGVIGEK